jgi:hypothetical protein
MCCIGNAAWAAKEVKVSSEGKAGYASDPIQITNWEGLQEEFKEAYGGKVFEAKSPMELEGFEDDKTPKAFILYLGEADIFSVINQPTPPKLGMKILELFSDLKKSDFKTYDQGVTLFAQDDKKGGHKLVAILVKSREKSDIAPSAVNLVSIKVNDEITVGFPSGSEIIGDRTTKASGLNVRNFSVEIPLLQKEAATYLTTQLSEKNVPFREVVSGGTASVTFQREGMRATVAITELDVEKQTSLILFIIYSKN